MPSGKACVKFHTLNADNNCLQTVAARMEYGEIARAAGFSLVARRHNSLSSTGRHLVFAFLLEFSLGMACTFAAAGAWLLRRAVTH